MTAGGTSRIFFPIFASFLILTFPALLQGEPFPLITTAAVPRIALELQAISTPPHPLAKPTGMGLLAQSLGPSTQKARGSPPTPFSCPSL